MKPNERVTSSALEALHHAAIENNLKQIKVNAQSFANKKLPRPRGDDMANFFEPDHLRYQHQVDEINKHLQFKTTLQQMADHTRLMEETVHDLNNKEDEAKQKLISAEWLLSTLPKPRGYNRMVIGLAAISAISLFEGLLATPFFEHYGYSGLLSLMLALLYAVVLGLLAYFFLYVVSLGRKPWQQRLIAFLFTLFLTMLFRFIAGPRAEYLNSVVNADSADAINQHFSAWPFVAISLLLFFTSVAIKFFVIPSKKERDELKEYQVAVQAKEVLEAEIASLTREKIRLREENNRLKAESASKLEYACMMEESIINHAREGYSVWKRQNFMHRQDGIMPDCFGQPYPFTFQRNFESIKTVSHEIEH